MTGSVLAVAVAMGLFVASHLALSSSSLRAPLVSLIGERGFRAVYSALSLALLVWGALAYRDAPVIDLWNPPIGLKHLSLLIMPIACVLLVCGLTTANPSAIGGDRPASIDAEPAGILALTRHPVMWGFALWGIAHLLANGDAAGLILFGGITFLALAGARAQDAKKQRQLGADWERFARRTSFLPLAALFAKRAKLHPGEIGWWRIVLGLVLFAVLLWLHPWLFGVSPLPA